MARYKHSTRHWIKDYFTFSKWQRRAILILLLLIILFAFLPALYPYLFPQKMQAASPVVLEKMAELVAFEKRDSANADFATTEAWREPAKTDKRTAPVYFKFDPNTATAAQWEQLGLRPKTIETILKYRSKGGKFKQAEDLLKIFSLPKEQAEKLIPYVVIDPSIFPQRTPFKKDSFYHRPASTKTLANIDINHADTTQWISLPGIGSKLAFRIVNFREKLGGFYSIDQVGETFALPDSTFQKIKPRLVNTSGVVKQININTATEPELKAHPYIRWNFSNVIVQYRTQHGRYAAVDELLKIATIKPEWLQKVRPYLIVE